MDILTTANIWHAAGIATIPIFWRQKTPRLSGWREFQNRLPTTAELSSWFSSQFVNLAVVTGWQKLAVIDFDDLGRYKEWYETATGEAVKVARETRRVLTAKGVHLYIYTEQAARNGHFLGGDIRAAGGYVLAPPSIHPTGAQYKWLDAAAPIVTVSSLEAVLPHGWQPEPFYTEQTATNPRSLWDVLNAPICGTTAAEVRDNVSILDLLPAAERSSSDGRWYKVACPFHDDKKPSFWIDTQRKMCGCHVCGMKPMDVINLYASLNAVSNRDALMALKERAF